MNVGELSKGLKTKQDRMSGLPQSPDIAPQTETSWQPPASADLLWPCFHTDREQRVRLHRRSHFQTLIHFFTKYDVGLCLMVFSRSQTLYGYMHSAVSSSILLATPTEINTE